MTPTGTGSGTGTARVDVVVVGGGIAGASAAANLTANGLSVLLLEKQDTYQDIVRGEWIAPWGMREAQLLGVEDAFGVGGAWEIREWVQWDETVAPDDAEVVDMTRFVPGVGGPMSFPHHTVCELMVEQAHGNGGQIVMGVRKVRVTQGTEPVVTYHTDAGEHEVRARIVLGATGRGCTVGRQVGVTMETSVHHWGGGVRVSGLDDWPMDVQAMGTEADKMFMVFPQGEGVARLYINFPTTNRDRYRGPNGMERFIGDFELECLPDRGKSVYAAAVPLGPLKLWPSVKAVPERPPVVDGVVLIGDEAGAADTVLGTGLSSALRDSRAVCGILLGGDDWSPAAFAPYLAERDFRMGRLHFGAEIVAKLHCEFGPEAAERRRRVRDLMNDNFAAQVTGLLNMVSPEDVPDFGFSEFFAERLFRETV
ncbi:flavin-dependent dehydrogenase [Saccharothrix ecbatanensis]|uniref:Flavin-dependent dehydrogenase n=1 Tax=Saccharothrix ecbatanensis TaxID=1105145 RepID=A0A7W9HIL7_9PSEU|nr:FAD-dependent oxidoreductase [Saccharothrix ecbatanensis]MBB5802524.1 flavin-dependent dehydrogenase [Saccharothrix ecbatanensis]